MAGTISVGIDTGKRAHHAIAWGAKLAGAVGELRFSVDRDGFTQLGAFLVGLLLPGVTLVGSSLPPIKEHPQRATARVTSSVLHRVARRADGPSVACRRKRVSPLTSNHQCAARFARGVPEVTGLVLASRSVCLVRLRALPQGYREAPSPRRRPAIRR